MDASRAFWNDQATAAKWRLDIPQARRLAVRQGLANLGKADEALADEIADAFTAMRRNEYRLYPDAHATVDALRDAGVKLALVTNGSSDMQRYKIRSNCIGPHAFSLASPPPALIASSTVP